MVGDASSIDAQPQAEPASLTMPAAVSPPTTAPKSPTNWNEAHTQYCTSHRVLRASLRQVVDEYSDTYGDVPWELPNSHQLVKSNEEFFSRLQHVTTTTTDNHQTPEPSRLVTLGKKIASTISSTLFYTDEEDYEVAHDWHPEHQDTFSEEASNLDLKVAIIHVALTKEALEAVQEQVLRRSQTSPWILPQSQWSTWCQETVQGCLSGLSREDRDWLLQLEIQKGNAKLVERQDRPNLVLFGLEHAAKEHLDTRVTLWDLNQAHQTLDETVSTLTKQVATLGPQALAHKKRGQTSQALRLLTRRKLLQGRIETSLASLLKIEQVQSAIESAQSNKSILTLLSQSSSILKELTSQTSVEEIDQVQEDLREELEALEEVQSALGQGHAAQDVDDDALLEELQALTIHDDDPPKGLTPDHALDTAAPSSTTKVTDTATVMANEKEPAPMLE